MYYVKKILEDIVDTAYRGHPKLSRYKRFYVEVSDKSLKSKNGDYNGATHRIRIFNPDRDPVNIVKTTIHELAHHIDTVNRGTSGHGQPFYDAYVRLLKAAIDMGIFSLDDFLATARDSQDGNKIRAMIRGYQPKENTYKADMVRITVANGYEFRESLKGFRFGWNPSSKVWQKEVALQDVKSETARLNDLGVEYRIEDARQMRLGKDSGTTADTGI